jgi:cell wall-associated NlpC family hydrolase
MQNSHFSLDPDSHGFRKEEPGANRTRSPSHGRKLKNEASAKRAEGAKLRQDKADHVLSAEEKKELVKRRKSHQKAARKELLETKAAHDAVDRANEDDNAGTEALNRGTEAAETGAGAARNSVYRNKLKSVPEGYANAASEPETGVYGSGKSGSGGYAAWQSKSGYAARMGSTAREAAGKAAGAQENAAGAGKAAQHQFMKKEFQRVASQKSTAEAANSFGSVTRKFIDRAEDIVGKIGEWIAEHLLEHALAVLILVTILIVVMIIGSGASSGHLISNLFGDSAIASSYTAEDEDIKTVNQDYKDLEADLQSTVDTIESDHPGYDEYRYTLSEIGHDPYELAAMLTVLYESYKPEEVQAKLTEIFDRQYELTLTPKTEIRTRTETRTGHHTVHNPDGTTDREEYTYEVEVQYEYHILNVTLTNASLDAVVNEIGFTDDQMKRYLLLKETYGNKKYLFEDDIYANPDADSGGSSGGSAGVVYEPSGEALTDSQFAAMWQEASKYPGRAYVWGGSSPSTGFDCSGFVCWVINHSGVGSVGRTTAEGLRQWTNTIPASERQPGDIIFFQGTYDTAGASHVGIYIGDGKMIHCGDPIKISNVDSGYFKQHFLCYGRVP